MKHVMPVSLSPNPLPRKAPLLNPPDETTSHSTRLQITAAKSLVIPHRQGASPPGSRCCAATTARQAGEETDGKGNSIFLAGEGANESLRDFTLNPALAVNDLDQFDCLLLHFNGQAVYLGAEMAVEDHAGDRDDQAEGGVV